MRKSKKMFRFVDLFAGLGGFHLALRSLGHECVFACESDGDLRKIYARNFGLIPEGDIRQIPLDVIPPHDILCPASLASLFPRQGNNTGLIARLGVTSSSMWLPYSGIANRSLSSSKMYPTS